MNLSIVYNLFMSQSLPLHLKITELLSRDLAAGRWRTGERLPPEAQLAERLGVAVGTLRKALGELENQGAIERRQGSGTYVKQALNKKGVYDFFRLELLQGGGLPTAIVLQFDCIAAPLELPAFGVSTIEKNNPLLRRQVYRVRRLRFLNNMPVALEEIYFDARHKANLAISDLGEALYLFYQQTLGFWIARAQDSVSAATVPAWAPALLDLAAESSCGFITRYAWSGEEKLEEFSYTWFNPQVAHYLSRLA